MVHRMTMLVSGVLLLWMLAAGAAFAHPGSGIVVNGQGDVFFTDTAKGVVWKLDRTGRLTSSKSAGGGHWLASDAAGSFAHADFKGWFDRHHTPNFQRVSPPDFNPSLLLADGVPFSIGRDGNLYYANRNLEICRLTPQGKASLLVQDMAARSDKLGGIKGLACGPDGSLYAAYPSAVLKISTDGKVMTVVNPIRVADCKEGVDPAMPRPYLRGLAVDADGTIFAAATGCRRVLKITPAGNVTTILTAAAPWTPTGVAIAGHNIYALEFTNAAKEPDWLPRVRKLGPDGKVSILATITR